MPKKRIYVDTIWEAVEAITPYLEDTSTGAHNAIYFDGWRGLAASAVLRAIAEHPPPSLREKFDKIIHVDCSKWKSRRALQRAIAEELKLPQRVMAILDRQDEEDDFNGVEEGSREKIQDVTREIYQALQGYRCLVVFHNGSSNMVELSDFGIPRPGLFNTRILWTFKGRLRLNPEINEKVDKSHLHLYDDYSFFGLKYLLQQEAREIARYTGQLGVTPIIATECCSYILSLNSWGGNIMDYNWAIHASNYWVCDGIIVQGGQDNEEAWDAATVMHQELRLDDYSSSTLPLFGHRLDTPRNRWIFVTDSMTVPPESTSFFLAAESGLDHPLATLPNDMFHLSDKLRVLKLCRCTFSFSSPPFHCCRNLRFLGLDSCKDDEPQEEALKQGRPEMGFFQSLWVLDICNTDWELALFPKIIEQIAPNIREIYIKKGRIWRGNLSWRQLHNIHKLRVIEPTSSWETGQKDEFTDMEKLELLDLSRNSTMQVLPSLSRAAGLKTLVLDGCVGLEHVGPEGVPPSLKSFSLDARAGGDHKISRIYLAGCARLVNFKLRGPLPNLKELDISESAVETLDLKDEVVHVPRLQQIILLGCKQLRSILWPKNGLTQLRILRSPRLYSNNIQQAVQLITPYLEETSSRTTSIYFDGWSGLAASAVLRTIAEHPPPSLREKFDKIIHLDCSRWKSQRALQRAIAEELKLPQRVMAILDRQDEEDDFSGVEEGSRAVIVDATREIHRTLQENRYLLVFHNGSNHTIDLNDFGVPRPEWLGSKVLWTFRGRLRLNPEVKEKVDISHLYLYDYGSIHGWKYLLKEEAREIARYNGKLGVTPEIATECCSYMLSLNSQGGSIMDYNWAIHASSYWVCDGIIVQGGQDSEEAWDAASALHQELQLEDYSSSTLPSFGHKLDTPPNHWIFITNSVTVPPESTSFFLAPESGPDHPLATLPNDMFHQSDKLRVLKLCRCTFSFSSPPFDCCRSLRFLGIDSCKDNESQEEAPKQGRLEMGFFQSLWVLDICNTDWGNNIAWRRLQILRKLRIIEPTSSWETGPKDEFTDLEKLELLDLSRNSTMQVLPSLSRAVGLKTLVLDGCVELEHVGPEGVPPSLESFSFDARAGGEHNIYRICLAGCARLVNFKLRGPLPNLKELDISESAVQTLDLKDEVVHVPRLQQIILLGCKKLRSILWPENGLQQLSILRIDNRVKEVRNLSPGSFVHQLGQPHVAIMDMTFVRSLVLRSNKAFCWKANGFNLVLCISTTSKEDVQTCNKKKMSRYSTSQVTGPPSQKSLIPKTPCSTYTDFHIDEIIIDHDNNSAPQIRPLDCHVEIGEGIDNNNVESVQVIEAIIFVMERVESLHVHDNSSITTVIPERMMSTGEAKIRWSHLKRCRVERCPQLGTVFATNYDVFCFEELETFWAADLPMAHCIWSKGRTVDVKDTRSFAKLRSIHLHSCPRLTFVLRLSYFPNLETLHIVYCGDLRQVFSVEAALRHLPQFPKLKHIYLHDLPSLQQICEAKMSAPMLETIRVRGCWSLRRLPAVDYCRRYNPTVDCEKDWWDKLEWDGLEASHHPSLFKPRHSLYYKKALPSSSVLR